MFAPPEKIPSYAAGDNRVVTALSGATLATTAE